MNPSPTYIHYRTQWQVLGPESPGQRFERFEFQRFFDKINSSREFGGYDDFSYRVDRCELVKVRGTVQRGGQAFSKVVYAGDSLTIVEEWTEHSTSEFAQHIKLVLDAWFECFPHTIAVVQNTAVRGLTVLQAQTDSRKFIGDDVLRLGDAFKGRLEKMPHKVGFTFGCQREQGNTQINIEAAASSWRDDRSVWLEVKSLALLREPLNAARHELAEAIFGRTTSFLENEMLPLLLYFDREKGKGSEEIDENGH